MRTGITQHFPLLVLIVSLSEMNGSRHHHQCQSAWPSVSVSIGISAGLNWHIPISQQHSKNSLNHIIWDSVSAYSTPYILFNPAMWISVAISISWHQCQCRSPSAHPNIPATFKGFIESYHMGQCVYLQYTLYIIQPCYVNQHGHQYQLALELVLVCIGTSQYPSNIQRIHWIISYGTVCLPTVHPIYYSTLLCESAWPSVSVYISIGASLHQHNPISHIRKMDFVPRMSQHCSRCFRDTKTSKTQSYASFSKVLPEQGQKCWLSWSILGHPEGILEHSGTS